jgi:hypothetical protein
MSQKSASVARDFCDLYPIENAQTQFAENGLANVSSSARSLMTVHRSIQTHGPNKRLVARSVTLFSIPGES